MLACILYLQHLIPQGLRVYSFEPESNNFQILMENILLNKMMNDVNPYPIGISNETYFTITNLYLDSFAKGQFTSYDSEIL